MVATGTWCPVLVLVFQKDVATAEGTQKRSTRKVKGLEKCSRVTEVRHSIRPFQQRKVKVDGGF